MAGRRSSFFISRRVGPGASKAHPRRDYCRATCAEVLRARHVISGRLSFHLHGRSHRAKSPEFEHGDLISPSLFLKASVLMARATRVSPVTTRTTVCAIEALQGNALISGGRAATVSYLMVSPVERLRPDSALREDALPSPLKPFSRQRHVNRLSFPWTMTRPTWS